MLHLDVGLLSDSGSRSGICVSVDATVRVGACAWHRGFLPGLEIHFRRIYEGKENSDGRFCGLSHLVTHTGRITYSSSHYSYSHYPPPDSDAVK